MRHYNKVNYNSIFLTKENPGQGCLLSVLKEVTRGTRRTIWLGAKEYNLQ